MKRNLCTLCFVFLFSLASRSQVVQKGDKLFGGSFSATFFNINGSGPNYNWTSNAGIFPSFAWTIKNDLTLGVKGGISYSRGIIKYDPDNKYTSSGLSISPGIFLKKYKTLKEMFGIYFSNELNGYYARSKQETPNNPTTKNSAWGGDYRFNPGVFYKFSDSFIGEANIGGVYASYYGNNGTHNTGVGVSFLQSFNIGFNYIIGKKKPSSGS